MPAYHIEDFNLVCDKCEHSEIVSGNGDIGGIWGKIEKEDIGWHIHYETSGRWIFKTTSPWLLCDECFKSLE